VFLVNFWCNYTYDFYSDLDEKSSKHILDALHEFLSSLNFTGMMPGGGPNNPNPDFSSYLFLFLNLEDQEVPEMPRFFTTYRDLSWYNSTEGEEFREIYSQKLDEFNKDLDYPNPKELIKEKNILMSKSSFIDYE